MKAHYLLMIACLLVACKSKPAKVNADSAKVKKVKVLPASYKLANAVSPTKADTSDIAEQLDAYADYYVVVADTGLNYYSLRDKMFDLNKSFNISIDTMERGYNKAKDLIALPDNYDDDIYAGEYYPRREPSNTLSLEYLNTYKHGAGQKTIALVTGIYETKASADSALQVIDKPETAFAFKAKVYIGCMH